MFGGARVSRQVHMHRYNSGLQGSRTDRDSEQHSGYHHRTVEYTLDSFIGRQFIRVSVVRKRVLIRS
jgi:hypothetical protein